MSSQNLFNGFNVVGNAFANTVTSNVYYVGSNIVIDSTLNSNIANLTVSNTVQTTNVIVNGVLSLSSTSVGLENQSGSTIIDKDGNLLNVPSISLSSPATISGASSISGTTLYGALAGSNVGAFSNLYASNALQTTNVFASGNVTATQFVSAGGFTPVAGGPTVGVTGNIYTSNALQTTNVTASGNVTATQFVSAGGFTPVAGGPTVGVTGNIYTSNALQTTNVFASNVFFSSVGLGTATAGEVLYNTYLYSTLNTTSGRGAVPVQQTYRLTGTPASVTALTPYYFFSSAATTSSTAINLEASSVYDIEMHCYFSKVTNAGTIVWTLIASSAPTLMSGWYQANPITGVGSGTPTTGYAASQASTTAAFPATGSLSIANHSFLFKIQVITNLATSFDIQATQSATGFTPIVGSYYRVTKIATTTGAFV